MPGSIRSVMREHGFEVLPLEKAARKVTEDWPLKLVSIRGSLPDGRRVTVMGHSEREVVNRLLFLCRTQSVRA